MSDAESVAALRAELNRVYDRIERHSDNTLNVMQYIILLFGAALLAAQRAPEVLVAVPLFWTVWLLHSVIVDFNTIKFSAYAQHLEGELTLLLGRPVAFWESRIAVRRNARPFIFNVNYAYWALLNGSSWMGGIAALMYTQHFVLATCLGCLWILLWGPAINHYRVRDHIIRRLREDMAKGATPSPGTDLPLNSLSHQVPALAISAVGITCSVTLTLLTDGTITTIATTLLLCWLIPSLLYLELASTTRIVIVSSSVLKRVKNEFLNIR